MTPTYLMPARVKWGTYVKFQRWLHFQLENGARSFTLDFSGVVIGYPDGLVPIVSIVTELRVSGAKCDVLPPLNPHTASVFQRSGWMYFLIPSAVESSREPTWSALPLRQYSSAKELNTAIEDVVHICLQQLVFAPGVSQALEWAISEIAGNVLDHSGAPVGWMQAVTYMKSRTLNIVVADAGIGIPESMRKRFPWLSDVDAITYAMESGVTSDPSLGQGNGLAGAMAIAEHNHGSFSLTSGRGRVEIYDDQLRATEWFPPQAGTIVGLQLSTDKPIDLTAAIWGAVGDGKVPPLAVHGSFLYMEKTFESDSGELILRVRDQAPSFGNRPTGQRIRNVALNLFENRNDSCVVIDIADIRIMSSSFADELFGKLVVLIGDTAFRTWIRIEGSNAVCRSIIDKAIAQRLEQSKGHAP